MQRKNSSGFHTNTQGNMPALTRYSQLPTSRLVGTQGNNNLDTLCMTTSKTKSEIISTHNWSLKIMVYHSRLAHQLGSCMQFSKIYTKTLLFGNYGRENQEQVFVLAQYWMEIARHHIIIPLLSPHWVILFLQVFKPVCLCPCCLLMVSPPQKKLKN